jgi:iron complex outermembrane receptor protein
MSTTDKSGHYLASLGERETAHSSAACRRLAPLLLAACCLAPLTARAQSAGSGPDAAASQGGSQLGEVLVTARKRSETLMSIPESVSAFGSAQIKDSHLTQIDDLGNLVSNLNIVTRADQTPDVVLRGVGSFGVVNGVGFYANDVQLFDGQTVRPEDLERIEVLKGPQGTLYGGSNVGGAIKYVTKLPTNDLEGEATAEVGEYGTQTYSTAVSGPIIPDRLLVRLSLFDTTTDGFIHDTSFDNRTVDGGTEFGGRLTIEYRGDNTTAILYLNGDRDRTGAANLLYTPATDHDYSLDVADGVLPSFTRSLYSATLNVEHQLNNGMSITSISSLFSSYSNVTTDVSKGPLPFLTAFQHFQRDVWSEELRLASSKAGPLTWLIGAFAQGNDPDLRTISRSFNGDPSNPANFNDPTQYSDMVTYTHQQHREYALFANGKYDWGQWSAEAGIRADYYNSSEDDVVYNLSDTQNGFSILPKISLSYHLDSNSMVYATISRGLEPGDVNEGADQNGNPLLTTYKAESTLNYELGIKSQPIKNLRFDAALFYIDYDNRLFQTNLLRGTEFINVTNNIGASQNYGGEFDVSWRIVHDLTASASVGVTKSVWGSINIFDPDLNEMTNLKGRTAPFTPEYQASISLDWSHEIAEGFVFGLRSDVSFFGKHYWDITDHYEQAPYQLVNLGARLEHDHWTLSAHVSNLFDTLYNTEFASAAEVGAPFNIGQIGRPRQWTVSLTYRY